MSSIKTTLLTNVFNEEYLLPFWLQHHKDMFDDIIIVDYRSTDRSMEICRQICPKCKIITTRNLDFGSVVIDNEFMELERSIEGVKIILNTTEFLITEKPLKDYFVNLTSPVSYAVSAYSPYSKKDYAVSDYYQLFYNLLNEDVVYNGDRGYRHIHTYPDGNYEVGRHKTYNPSVPIDNMYLLWFGYYPFNEKLLARKLQIQKNIPLSDPMQGLGYHHFFPKEKVLAIRETNANTGKPLQELNSNLYHLLHSQYKNKTYIVIGGCGFIGSHMVDKLISLGYKVIVIDNLTSGNVDNLNNSAHFEFIDFIDDYNLVESVIKKHGKIDGLFHFASAIKKGINNEHVNFTSNILGTIRLLELCKSNGINRIVFSSKITDNMDIDNIIMSYLKESRLSICSIKYPDVYGKRQHAGSIIYDLIHAKKTNGKYNVSDTQSKLYNCIHVSDVVNANLLAMFNTYCGSIEIYNELNTSLKQLSLYLNCPIEYRSEKKKNEFNKFQSNIKAYGLLGWKCNVDLEDGIDDVLVN